MAKYVVDVKSLVAVAEAIRKKTGKSASMTLAQMPTEIERMSNKIRSIAQGDGFTLTADELAGISRLYDYAFYRTLITSIELPTGISSIGASSFEGCQVLKKVTIPEGVYNILTSCFRDCITLENVTFPKSLNSLGNHSFRNTGMSQVIIPSSDITVGYGVFTYCKKLTHVTFQGNVRNILGYVFKGCTSLKLVDFTACTSVPTLLSSDVFDAVPSTCEVRVPSSLYDAWITATNWSECSDLIIPY